VDMVGVVLALAFVAATAVVLRAARSEASTTKATVGLWQCTVARLTTVANAVRKFTQEHDDLVAQGRALDGPKLSNPQQTLSESIAKWLPAKVAKSLANAVQTRMATLLYREFVAQGQMKYVLPATLISVCRDCCRPLGLWFEVCCCGRSFCSHTRGWFDPV
jgi:hypothetical protein